MICATFSFPGAYNCLMAAAVFIALRTGYASAIRQGVSPRDGLWLALVTVASGYVGSKLMMCITYPALFQPTHMDFWLSAGTFYGGLVGALLSLQIAAYLKRISVGLVLDAAAPALALGQVFGRTACFAAGCCWGTATDVCWGVCFSREQCRDTGVPFGVALHPVQIYEAALCLVLYWWLRSVAIKRRMKGSVASSYLVAYGVVRFNTEWFRDDPRGDVCGLTSLIGLSTSQMISILLISAGLIANASLAHRARQTASAPGDGP